MPPFAHVREDGMVTRPASKWLKSNAKQVDKWLTKALGIDYDDYIILRVFDSEHTFSIGLWNIEDEFSLSFTLPTRGKAGYIGAGRTARAPRVGEQHRRGRDLYDGKFNEETWQGVLRDVLRCSLLRVAPDVVTMRHRKTRARKVRVVVAK